MSQPCAITTCKRISRALCYCCQQSVCLQHLKEHNDLLVAQLNPLVDQINSIGDRLKSINGESKIGNCRQKLEEWRMDCHKKIDDFFEQKYQDINQRVSEKVEKQREEIDQIQSKIGVLLREEEVSRQDIDLLTWTIQKLDREVNKFEHTNFNIELQPVVIDDSLIDIEESNINGFDLSKMSPVCKTIAYTNKSCVSLASNDRFLLIHQLPDLCLIDRNFEIVRQTPWNYGEIRSMCWLSSFNRFIIISENGVFSIDERAMSTEKLQIIQERKWMSCTCSDTSLFLSTYELASSVIEYSLLPSIEIIKEWKSPDTCREKEWITDMKYNHGSIALLINNTSKKILFIELRNIKTLDRLWSFQMDSMDVQNRSFYCCLLDDQEWLVMDHKSGRLAHITKDGKIKSTRAYDQLPFCADILGPDTIAISTTNSVNFHKLS
jgi:hypothetical protein